VIWKWLKGHAGHTGNEVCDQLANAEVEKIMKTFSREQLKAALEEFSAKEEAGRSAGELFAAFGDGHP
jgi:ribonuclease HI